MSDHDIWHVTQFDRFTVTCVALYVKEKRQRQCTSGSICNVRGVFACNSWTNDRKKMEPTSKDFPFRAGTRYYKLSATSTDSIPCTTYEIIFCSSCTFYMNYLKFHIDICYPCCRAEFVSQGVLQIIQGAPNGSIWVSEEEKTSYQVIIPSRQSLRAEWIIVG